jgi:hypothetical protein
MNQNERNNKTIGIAGFFDKVELRSYFLYYLYTVIGIEIMIFLIAYFGSFSTENPFPWKFYFLLSFSVPVGMTFLLGTLIIAFNHFLFGRDAESPMVKNPTGVDTNSSTSLPFKFFSTLGRGNIPFLAILLLLLIGAIFVYNLDAILAFSLQAGEGFITYILFPASLLLSAAAALAAVWVFVNYRLRRKQMDYEYRFRAQAMERMGLLIIEDQTVIDRGGHVVNRPDWRPVGSERKPLKVLPPLPVK